MQSAEQRAEKLSITLPTEMVSMIRDRVQRGFYGSNSEVIREAMRAWMKREAELKYLDDAIAAGIADIEAGRFFTMEEVIAEIDEWEE